MTMNKLFVLTGFLFFINIVYARDADVSREEETIEIEEEDESVQSVSESEQTESSEKVVEIEMDEEVVVDAEKIENSEIKQVEKKVIVTEREIQESGARNLGDAMSNQLGVQVSKQAYSNRGSPQGIQIQGCEPSRVLILVDGKKVIGNSDGIVDTSQLPLDNVKKIEIVKGSSSAAYGSDAICGVVNIITNDAGDKGSFKGKAEYGSYHARQFSASLRTPLGEKTAMKLDTGYFGTEGFDMDKSDKSTDGDKINSVKTALGFEFKPTENWKIGLDGDFYYENRERTSSFVKGDNPKEYFSLLSREVFRGGGAFSLVYDFNQTDKLEFKIYDNYFRRNSVDDLKNSPDIDERFTDNNLLNTALSGKVLLGTWNYLQAGVGFDYEWLDDRKEAVKVIDSETSETEKKSNVDNKSVWNTAVFVQDEMTPFEWWTLVPGVRFSYSEDFSYMFTPKLALKFFAHDRVSINTSYGMGYKTPTLKHLYYTFEHTVFGNIIGVNGNPDLKPETSHSVNLGIDIVPYGKKSLISVNGYFNQYFDFIDIDYSNAQWIGGDSYYTYKNIGKARTYGLESQVRFPFLKHFTLSAGYVLLFADNMDTDKTLPHRPRHQAKGQFRFYHKKWGLTATVSGMYQSSVYTDAVNTIESSQFFLLNAYLEKSFLDESLRLYVRGSNLTNVKRVATDRNDLRPQPGIEIFGGISWDYSWKKGKNKEK